MKLQKLYDEYIKDKDEKSIMKVLEIATTQAFREAREVKEDGLKFKYTCFTDYLHYIKSPLD